MEGPDLMSPVRPQRFVAARTWQLRQPGWRATEAQIADLSRRGLDVLKVYGMPVRKLPEHVTLAAQAAAAELLLPPPSRGTAGLRGAIAEKLLGENGLQVDPERQIVVTNGAMQAINVVCRALLDPGDEVLIPAPTFFFYGMIELAGGTPVYVPTNEASGWSWDLDRIEGAITPRTKFLILCSPVNPTGHVVPEPVIRQIFELAEARDFLVVADESYDRMVYDGRTFASAANLRQFRDRLILVQSVTKSYAMAAWRVGYLVAPDDLVDEFAKVLEWETLYGNAICQRAAEAAIRGPQTWLADIATEFQGYRDEVWPHVAETPGLSCVKPGATPYMLVNVSALGINGDQFADLLVQEFGVPATGGSHFEAPFHTRIGFGGRDKNTRTELWQRIEQAAARVLAEQESSA
jgi:aspartate/methionine/tyrosine aminotransferase